jgi:hypothetical protein
MTNGNYTSSNFGGNTYGGSQTDPNGYVQGGAQAIPQKPTYSTGTSAFEPNDPIPEDTTNEETDSTPDRKHWPRFMDYFVKKNGGNDNN